MRPRQKQVINNKIKIGELYKIKNTILFYPNAELKAAFQYLRISNCLILVLGVNKTAHKHIVSTEPSHEFLRYKYTLKILFKDIIGSIHIHGNINTILELYEK